MGYEVKERAITSRPAFVLILLAGLLVAAHAALTAPARENLALVLTIDGPIGPATADYFQRGLAAARQQDASLVILRLDTPGGLATSMRTMIKAILASPIPVATYVTPPGARAASAGTYLLYSSHIAAMAPTTNLGSATPVQLGGLPGSAEPADRPADNSEEPAATEDEDAADSPQKRRGNTPMERKVLEDAVAYIRGLAGRHGRNADWAEKAVREGANLTAKEAAERNVIDLVAPDIEALLEHIHGLQVMTAAGMVTLETRNLEVRRFDPDWRTNLLSVITNPTIAYFLMLIGFYGLLFELMSPGAMVPGVIGAISLMLALFAFQILSVNYAGLGLVVLGLAFIIGEAFLASFGILGIGGIIAFVVGSIILMDGTRQAISWPLIGGTAAVAAGFMFWTVIHLVKLRKRPSTAGPDLMCGAEARVVVALRRPEGEERYRGKVFVHGETWNAVSDKELNLNDTVKVIQKEGLVLQVVPVNDH